MGKKVAHCHDCGVREGEIHDFGCDMERCPFCGGQLITCDCCYKKLGILDRKKWTAKTAYLPPEIYTKGLSDEQNGRWIEILFDEGRVPYIRWPNLCGRCGEKWPDMFHVPDVEWERYVDIRHREEMLCRKCYDEIKALIDRAETLDCRKAGG